MCIRDRAQPAHRVVLQPHRQRLPRAAAAVPLHHQLLHHRLVPAVAEGRAGGGGDEVPQGRGAAGQAADQHHGGVQEVPRGRAAADEAVPRRGGPLQLRHSHQLFGAAEPLQHTAGYQADGGGQPAQALRQRAGQAHLHRAAGGAHAGGAHRAEAQPGADGERHGDADGQDPAREDRGGGAQEAGGGRGGGGGEEAGRGGQRHQAGVRGGAGIGHPGAQLRHQRAQHAQARGHQAGAVLQEPPRHREAGDGGGVRDAGHEAHQDPRPLRLREDDQ
eukprot:258064-Pyramimonas_sp.AAC.1